MGGDDSLENLIELTPEEHAEAHKKLYEQYGHWQDYLAWKGLSKIFSHDDCVRLAIIEGAKKGAIIGNAKRWFNHVKKDRKYPKGVDGRKIRDKRYWFNNGKEEGQFSLNDFPKKWKRGRLKSSLAKSFKNISL